MLPQVGVLRGVLGVSMKRCCGVISRVSARVSNLFAKPSEYVARARQRLYAEGGGGRRLPAYPEMAVGKLFQELKSSEGLLSS